MAENLFNGIGETRIGHVIRNGHQHRFLSPALANFVMLWWGKLNVEVNQTVLVWQLSIVHVGWLVGCMHLMRYEMMMLFVHIFDQNSNFHFR